MTIKLMPISREEVLEELGRLEGTLTVCRIIRRPNSGSIYMNLPRTFPDYDKLKCSTPIYFIEEDNKMFFDIKPPNHGNYIERRIAIYGPKTYFKVTIPHYFVKKYNLYWIKQLQLVQKDNRYACIWLR